VGPIQIYGQQVRTHIQAGAQEVPIQVVAQEEHTAVGVQEGPTQVGCQEVPTQAGGQYGPLQVGVQKAPSTLRWSGRAYSDSCQVRPARAGS
jgi:hypothetical protein